MKNGPCNKYLNWYRKADSSDDESWEEVSPFGAWCAIEPLPPGATDGQRAVTHIVRMRFHPEIAGHAMDVRGDYADPMLDRTRSFYGRGVQNVDEKNNELRLLAEEVLP